MTNEQLKNRTQQTIDAIPVLREKEYGWAEVEKMLNEILIELDDSPWLTGTPTEEGDYLCWVKGPFGIKHGLYYNRCKYKDGNWFDDEVTDYNLKNMRFQVIAWQKIEPYKGDIDNENE